MCRVQQGAVSCSNTTCHLYLGRFSSLCQYLSPPAREPSAPSQQPAGVTPHTVGLAGPLDCPCQIRAAGTQFSCLPPSFTSNRIALFFLSFCSPAAPTRAVLPGLAPRCSAGSGASSSSWWPRPCLPAAYQKASRRRARAPAVNYDIKISRGLIIGFVCFLQTDAPLFMEPVL